MSAVESMYQPGIVSPQPDHLLLATFDLQATGVESLHALLRAWTETYARVTTAPSDTAQRTLPQGDDTGEALGVSAPELTATFGLGASLFDERLGLAEHMPPQLAPLPTFRGDALEPARSDGDLLIQICADDSQATFHALHSFTRAAHQLATPRWVQSGFLQRGSASRETTTPRNVLGFKDGTANVTTPNDLRDHVWTDIRDSPAWMEHGTYLVFRRVRTLLDTWDATSLSGQERAIGRHKISGAPLGLRNEHAPLPLKTTRAGEPVIPADAHVRLAAPESNAGARLLRRSYNYLDGVDTKTGQLDTGVLFLAFQRDPHRQFAGIQRRLAEHDALSKHLLHTASATFAIPPASRPGEPIAVGLLTA